jgi:hypothetical protein
MDSLSAMKNGLLDYGPDEDEILALSIGAERNIALHLGPSAHAAPPAVQPLVPEHSSPSVAMTIASHTSTESQIVQWARAHPVVAATAAVVVVGGLGWAIIAAFGGKALIGAAAL